MTTSERTSIQIKTFHQEVLNAPVIYIDGVEGFLTNDHTVKINLVQDRFVNTGGLDPATPLERVTCARLVMAPDVFIMLSNWMVPLAERLQETMKQKG